MITAFSNSESAVSNADLDKVEQEFGFAFPREFRELYLHFNGGRPEKNRFVDEKGTCIVSEFLSISHGNSISGTLESSIQRVKVDQSLLPDYLVQFAVDPGGDYYCFTTRTDDYGKIYLFHMDKYNDHSRAVEYLAASLDEFLSKLSAKGRKQN